jgi:hypothetical protein
VSWALQLYPQAQWFTRKTHKTQKLLNSWLLFITVKKCRLKSAKGKAEVKSRKRSGGRFQGCYPVESHKGALSAPSDSVWGPRAEAHLLLGVQSLCQPRKQCCVTRLAAQSPTPTSQTDTDGAERWIYKSTVSGQDTEWTQTLSPPRASQGPAFVSYLLCRVWATLTCWINLLLHRLFFLKEIISFSYFTVNFGKLL